MTQAEKDKLIRDVIDDGADHYQSVIDRVWIEYGIEVTHAEVCRAALRLYLANRALLN